MCAVGRRKTEGLSAVWANSHSAESYVALPDRLWLSLTDSRPRHTPLLGKGSSPTAKFTCIVSARSLDYGQLVALGTRQLEAELSDAPRNLEHSEALGGNCLRAAVAQLFRVGNAHLLRR